MSILDNLQLTHPDPGAPLIVSDGMGVDSTAVLVALHAAGITPDLILFADTGGEKDATYAYIAKQNAWLRSVGFPEVTVVKYNTLDSTDYDSLPGNCHTNETLPSLAFGKHSCSVKWKIQPQDFYVQGWGLSGKRKTNNRQPGWQPAINAWHRGSQPVKVIGYDDSPADRKRAGKVHGKVHQVAKTGQQLKSYTFWYPLQQLGWKRAQCIEAIQAAGLEVPVKSACYHCPASKQWELWWLAAAEPHNLVDACKLEFNALTGKHSRWDTVAWGEWDSHLATGKSFPDKTHCGLGRSFSWCKWAYDNNVLDLDTWEVIVDPEVALARSRELRSQDNAADVRGCAAADLDDQPQVIKLVDPRRDPNVSFKKPAADPRLDPNVSFKQRRNV